MLKSEKPLNSGRLHCFTAAFPPAWRLVPTTGTRTPVLVAGAGTGAGCFSRCPLPGCRNRSLSWHEKSPPHQLFFWSGSSHWDLSSQPAGAEVCGLTVPVSCGTAWADLRLRLPLPWVLGWNAGRCVPDACGCGACCGIPLGPQVAPRCRRPSLQSGRRLLRLLRDRQCGCGGAELGEDLTPRGLARSLGTSQRHAQPACCLPPSPVADLTDGFLRPKRDGDGWSRGYPGKGLCCQAPSCGLGEGTLSSCSWWALERRRSPLQGTRALDKWKNTIKSICREIADALGPRAPCNIKLPVMSVTLHSYRHH